MSELGDEKKRIALVSGELFYRDGINATGVAPVSKAAGISKRTLYERFGSKDELVASALHAYDEPVFEQFVLAAEQVGVTPHEQLLGLFDGLKSFVASPSFRGCPFVNAAAELPDSDHPGRAVAREHKDRLRSWIAERAGGAGADDPAALADQLMVVFDGALAQSLVYGTPEPASAARGAAERLMAFSVRESP